MMELSRGPGDFIWLFMSRKAHRKVYSDVEVDPKKKRRDQLVPVVGNL
jgi:hypothetical protein